MMRKLLCDTMLLSASHFIVRLLGFVMRIWLSRELGSSAMGMVELTQSLQLLLITPVVSGMPAAVSRMCAKAEKMHQVRILRIAAVTAVCISLPVAIGAYYLRIPLCLWLGDLQTMPALLAYLPCLPVLALSCVLNGYYYGTRRPLPPAISEIIEQVVRLLLCIFLLRFFSGWPVAITSAIPAAASTIGEAAAVIFMILLSAKALFFSRSAGGVRAIMREMFSLAIPLTGMRLVASLMRTTNAVLIPQRLQAAGLSSAEALAKLGMINGMMMPILTLPSFITCSLNMIAGPELTKRQADHKPLSALTGRILSGTFAMGLAASAAVYILSPVLSNALYRQPDLLPLLRRACPLIPIMALTQVTGGVMNSLGLQGTSLKISLIGALFSVILTYVLAAQPGIIHWGVVIAIAFTQFLTLMLNLRAIKQEAEQ